MAYIVLFCGMLNSACIAQKTIADKPHKKWLLKGNWLLIGSVMEGKAHAIDSAEYKGYLTFRCFHNYREEAYYEGYHWIIKGKWKVTRHSPAITIIGRHYVKGKLEDKPVDVKYELEALDKKKWTATTIDKGLSIKVGYQKIRKRIPTKF